MDNPNQNKSLYERIREGDQDALEEFGRILARMFSYLRKQFGSEAPGSAVRQVLESLPKFRGKSDGELITFAARVGRYHAINKVRQSRLVKNGGKITIVQINTHPSSHKEQLTTEPVAPSSTPSGKVMLTESLATLTPTERAIAELLIQGYTVDEIKEKTGLSAGDLYRRKLQIEAKLKRYQEGSNE